jgi:hypothetical protein
MDPSGEQWHKAVQNGSDGMLHLTATLPRLRSLPEPPYPQAAQKSDPSMTGGSSSAKPAMRAQKPKNSGYIGNRQQVSPFIVSYCFFAPPLPGTV